MVLKPPPPPPPPLVVREEKEEEIKLSSLFLSPTSSSSSSRRLQSNLILPSPAGVGGGRMGSKGKWFGAVKRALIPQCCQGQWKGLGRSKHFSLLSAKEVESAVQDAALLLPLPPDIDETELPVNEAERSSCSYSVALASAFAAEAAAVAVRAATEVVRLASSSTIFSGKSREDAAATKIQAALRGYQARRSFRALRGLLRLKRVVDGIAAKTQTTKTLHCMQTMARVQTQLQSRNRMKEEEVAVQRHQQQKCEKEMDKLKVGEGWDFSSRSKEQAEAKLTSHKEAASRRERTLAYAFSHQWKSSSRSLAPVFKDAGNPQLGWNWLAGWMTGKSEQQNTTGIKDCASVKCASPAGAMATASLFRPAQKSNQHLSRQSPALTFSGASSGGSRMKAASPKGSHCSVDCDSKTVRFERERRHSTGGLSMKDFDSLAGSPRTPSYMAPTESARARSRLPSPHATEAPKKGSVSSVKNHLTASGADKHIVAAKLRRLSCP